MQLVSQSSLLLTTLQSTAWKALPEALFVPGQQTRWARRLIEVILTQDHPKLGKAGDVVKVDPGHQRHTLYPEKRAVYATPKNMKLFAKPQVQVEKSKTEKDKKQETLENILNTLKKRTVVISRRYNWRSLPEYVMLQPVNQKLISEAVEKQLGISLPQPLMLMKKPITAYGNYRVPLNLRDPGGEQIDLQLKVQKYNNNRAK